MKIKENREFKFKVLGNQKEFKEIKHACDQADDVILELQVKHDDLLEEFRKNLTLDSDNSFVSKQNYNLNSNVFGKAEPESVYGTNASVEGKQNFSSALQNSNFNNSINILSNPMFLSNNSTGSGNKVLNYDNGKPNRGGNHHRFQSLNPGDANSKMVRDQTSSFLKNQKKKFSEMNDPISRKVYGSLNKTLVEFFLQNSERKGKEFAFSGIGGGGSSSTNISSNGESKILKDDSWIKKTGENSFSGDMNTSRYEIQINDSKNFGCDPNPVMENRKITQNFFNMNTDEKGGRPSGQMPKSYGKSDENKENMNNYESDEKYGRSDRVSVGGRSKVKSQKKVNNISEEKIMNAIRRKIHNL